MGNLLAWVTSPPIIAVPIYIVIRSLSDREGNVPIEILALAIFFVLALTIMYIWASLSNLLNWLAPLQLLAQGVVISVLATQFALPFVLWTGVLLVIIGLVLSGSIVFSKDKASTVTTGDLTSYDIFESYPYPACVSDKEGSVISVSHGLVQLIGKNKEDLWRTNIENIIPPNEKVSFGEKLLRVIRQESKDRTWFTLKEEDPSNNRDKPEMLIKDLETEIFSKEYCKIRIEEEIMRIKRYKRWAIFMMVKISFVDEEDPANKQSESAFFRSFCTFIKNSLRNSDTISRVDEFSVFIILPETLSEDPVNEVIGKILGFSEQLSNVINQLKCKISPSVSHIFYNASSRDISFEDIMAALNNTLAEHEYT